MRWWRNRGNARSSWFARRELCVIEILRYRYLLACLRRDFGWAAKGGAGVNRRVDGLLRSKRAFVCHIEDSDAVCKRGGRLLQYEAGFWPSLQFSSTFEV